MTEPTRYQRRPGDVVIRRLPRRTERVVVAARRQPKRPLSPTFVLAASFAVAIALGTLLLTLPFASAAGQWTSPRVALFTATSAITLTGLVLVDTATYWSPLGQGLIVGMIELGGIGFMTGASLVFVAFGRRLSLRERVIVSEAVGNPNLGYAARVAKRVTLMTIGIQAAGAVVLLMHLLDEQPLDQALWFAVFHAVSAFNNAGFDITGNLQSLVGYQRDPVVLSTIAVLIALGGLSYFTIADLATRRSFTRLNLDSKVVFTTSAVLWTLGFLAFLPAEWSNPHTLGPLDGMEKVLNALFLSVTARTAGFNTVDTAGLYDRSLFLTITLMFVGGASASMAGGIRVNTFSALLVAILATLLGRREVRVFRRTLPATIVNRALAIALLAVAFVVGMTYLMSIVEPAPFLSLLFEVVSAFATVGLSTGITPDLSPAGSLLIAATMLIGRLGPLTLAVLLAQHIRETRLRFAEESLRVG